ncbi:MAG: YopX family protein [Clostridia bacterium]|jgi:uncharacterized phage protein (TIGR01671 family)
MRDIKFRVWDKEYEKMTYFNDEDYEYKPPFVFRLDQVLKKDSNYDDYEDFEYNDVTDSVEVMQYTGLKDKNGKEIYEGDIIEFSYDMFVGNFDTFVAKGKVVFKEGAFYVEIFENERTTKDEAYLLYSINLDTIEVIGNIHDNPELLEEI